MREGARKVEQGLSACPYAPAGRSARPQAGGRRSGSRPGITMPELLIVMIMMGIIATIALPRLDLRGIRMNSAARQVNMTMLAAQRTAIQKQHNVVVAFDTINQWIRVHEDADNDLAMDNGELVRTIPLPEGSRFGLGGATARAIGAAPVTFLKTQAGLPAVTFSRAGTASEIGGFYLSSPNAGVNGRPSDARAFEVERATGRTERFEWVAATNTWRRAF